MALLRPEIEALEQNGITRVAMRRIDDPGVIPLWFGEGDIVTPGFIREAAKRALDEGFTFYGGTRGRIELREAIGVYLERLYGQPIAVERITCPGSSMLGITMAAQMALGTGDHGLIVSPNWPNIDRAFAVSGARFDYVRQRERDGSWALEIEELFEAVRPETRAVFINSPCNPTGWVMKREEQAAVLDFCRARNIVIIADEVYHRNVFEGDVAPSFLEIAGDEDPVIVVNGFSKAFAMTGWRIGWMVTPRRYAEQMAVLSECFNTSATSFVQRAAITALEQGEGLVAELRERYLAGRAVVMEVLDGHPRLQLSAPQGAFYVFPRVHGMRSSLEFVEGVLEEEDVGLAPGYTFGPGNEEYFRLCFALSTERLKEALQRIIRYLDRHDNDFGANV